MLGLKLVNFKCLNDKEQNAQDHRRRMSSKDKESNQITVTILATIFVLCVHRIAALCSLYWYIRVNLQASCDSSNFRRIMIKTMKIMILLWQKLAVVRNRNDIQMTFKKFFFTHRFSFFHTKISLFLRGFLF